MIRWLVLGLLAAGSVMPVRAAMVVVSEGDGQVSKQYFEAGEFLQMRDDRPAMGVDRQGNCWFVEHRRVVSDPCEQMLQSMEAVRERMLESLSEEDRAMMQRALKMQRTVAPATVKSLGQRRIAGYSVECHQVGASHEICTSEKLLQEVKTEMGDSHFIELFRQFGKSAGEMGGETPESKAMADLTGRGFPMLDMQKVPAMPGLDPAVLQYMPEAQRAQIMSRLSNATGGTKMHGTKVTRVVKDIPMPDIDLSRFPRVDFERYLRQNMGQSGAMPDPLMGQ